jgi:hypothetical protein
MERRRKLVVFSVGTLLLLVSGTLGAYFLMHGMTQVRPYEKGAPILPHHILVATQGSAFKDRLVSTLAAQLERRPAYVKVIDVGRLADIDAADWNAIVIVHTWEIGKAPRSVTRFVARLAEPGRIIDVTTSGSGRERLPGVDVLSSASKMDEVPELVVQVIARIDARLAAP